MAVVVGNVVNVVKPFPRPNVLKSNSGARVVKGVFTVGNRVGIGVRI